MVTPLQPTRDLSPSCSFSSTGGWQRFDCFKLATSTMSTHSDSRAAAFRDRKRTVPAGRFTRTTVHNNTSLMLLESIRHSRRKLHNISKGNQTHESRISTHTREHPTVTKSLPVTQRGRCRPRLFQLANWFGAVFPLKRSSDWALRSLFWMCQRKPDRGTRQHERAAPHSPPYQMNNKQMGLDFCTYVSVIPCIAYTWYVRMKKCFLFRLFLT